MNISYMKYSFQASFWSPIRFFPLPKWLSLPPPKLKWAPMGGWFLILKWALHYFFGSQCLKTKYRIPKHFKKKFDHYILLNARSNCPLLFEIFGICMVFPRIWLLIAVNKLVDCSLSIAIVKFEQSIAKPIIPKFSKKLIVISCSQQVLTTQFFWNVFFFFCNRLMCWLQNNNCCSGWLDCWLRGGPCQFIPE